MSSVLDDIIKRIDNKIEIINDLEYEADGWIPYRTVIKTLNYLKEYVISRKTEKAD